MLADAEICQPALDNPGHTRTFQTLGQISQTSGHEPTKANFMKQIWTILAVVLMAATSTAALAVDPAEEGWLDGPWRYSGVIYGWLPHAPMDLFLDGEELGNAPESLSNILKALQMAAMLEFEADKGRLGFLYRPFTSRENITRTLKAS
jgi:hypothetical protein